MLLEMRFVYELEQFCLKSRFLIYTTSEKAVFSQNYESCFVFENLENSNLEERYEILNESGVSSIVWQSEGVFIFLATVIDPEYRLVANWFVS